MDSLHFCIAVTPLALYIFCLGVFNLRGKPTVVGGAADAWWLGLALMGLAISGPIQLFVPETAADRFGSVVWLLLATLYLLVLVLIALSMRPKLVIYNVTSEEISEPLIAAARELDPQAVRTGESLVLPTLGVQMYQDQNPQLRNVQLIATSRHQSVQAWHQFHKLTRHVVGNMSTQRPWYAIWMVVGSCCVLLAVVFELYSNHQTVAQSLQDFLQR